MRKTGTNVSEYIELYNQAWSRLMEKQHLSALREDADRSILTTWTLSFNSLQSQSKDAANLLILWAFLDDRDLWYELFAPVLDFAIANKDEVPPWFASCVGDKLEFKECMGLLLEYSFIDAKMESSSFSMHSVLHHWCFHTFEGDKATMSWLAMIVVAAAAPLETTPHYPLIQRRLLPHCDRVNLMFLQSKQGDFMNREDPLSVSSACHELGILYSNQGKMKEAEDMYLRALAGREKAWGPKHTSTLNTVNNLGILYRHQGKMEEAEDMYLRALAGREKAWGPKHKQPLDTRYNLGLLYEEQSRFGSAVEQFELVVKGYAKLLGPDHSKTVSALSLLDDCKERAVMLP